MNNGYGSLAETLREARLLTQKISDQKLRDRLTYLLSEIELALPQSKTNISAISDDDMAAILKGMHKRDFDDEKLALLKTIAGQFSSAQAAQIIQCLTGGSEQVDALIYMYPNLTDPSRIEVALEAITFSSDKKEAEERINNLIGHAA